MILRWMFVIIILVLVLPTSIFAQDGSEDYTCDDGENDVLNAAQTAFDDGDFESALELAGIAEGLCSSDIQRFMAASDIKTRAQAALNQQALQALEPGLVQVEDYSIFMVCEGQANEDYLPVIFENGLGEVYTTWRDVNRPLPRLPLRVPMIVWG